MKNKVLITSVGRKVSLVKAFREVGWHVTGQDPDQTAIALNYCDNWITDLFINTYDLIVPTRDAEIKPLKSGYPLGTMAPKVDVVDTCTDKLRFYQWCKPNGFRSPEVYFVKPRISKSGKETECVFQEFVDGEELSIDLFSDFSSNVISIVPRVRSKVVNGESSVTTTVSNPTVISESKRLAEALGLVGHNVLQSFYKDGEVVWTDVNCRFGGASIVGIKAGCKSPEWLLKLVNGEKVEPCIGEYTVGLTGKSYSEWSFE